ncbi:hypothetical protein [Pedobacter lusitanus]
MAELDFSFSAIDYDSLQNEEITIQEFIDIALRPSSYDEESPMDIIGNILMEPHSHEGGAPEISGVEIVEVEFDKKKK